MSNVAIEENTTEIQTVESNVIPLSEFVSEFQDGLLDAVSRTNPPVYDGVPNVQRTEILEGLLRRPFDAQQNVVQSVAKLLIDENEKAAIINGEMGCGKTLISIACAAVLDKEGYKRHLIICPPHLCYKWRREIMMTVPGARVWVLNGPDTIRQLIRLRELIDQMPTNDGPEFFVLGRVRMRMGFHWKPALATRKKYKRVHVEEGNEKSLSYVRTLELAACPDCGETVLDDEGEPVLKDTYLLKASDNRLTCRACKAPLWTLMRPGKPKSKQEILKAALCGIPTIGPKTADKLIQKFNEDILLSMLSDNVYEFINLCDESGDLIFSDRQAQRMERALAKTEFGFGQGGYQPTEFIKRYLPDNAFANLVVDEGHEYKGSSSATGQAMGVLAGKVRKVILLTGTLMGGYADDLFSLFWRIMPERMMEDGYRYNSRNTLGSATQLFMRDHGILKDIYKEVEEQNYRTARGKRMSVRTVKAPGFGPQGIARYVLPFTAFLKLKDIGSDNLPGYQEHFVPVSMSSEQMEKYKAMESKLKDEMKERLRKGDKSLLGVVLNVLLRWPDTCFRPETVKHPRTRDLLSFTKAIFSDTDIAPKEQKLIELCKEAKLNGRKVLVYSTYTGTQDTTSRLSNILKQEGFKVAVLRSSVSTSKREDWIADQVERGVEVVITNPDLVKTGLDLLEFPTIVFMQSGYNVYTLQQAARRSWRIGQTVDVEVYFLGYEDTMQIACLSLMAKKIEVSQSTSGDIPDSGLDTLNPDEDSIEVAMAKQLAA